MMNVMTPNSVTLTFTHNFTAINKELGLCIGSNCNIQILAWLRFKCSLALKCSEPAFRNRVNVDQELSVLGPHCLLLY